MASATTKICTEEHEKKSMYLYKYQSLSLTLSFNVLSKAFMFIFYVDFLCVLPTRAVGCNIRCVI